MEDDNIKKDEVYVSYDETIQELTKTMLTSDDSRIIEACGKAIDNVGKRKLEEEKAEIQIELDVEKNELAARELDIQEKKIASENKGNWLRLIGGVLTTAGALLGIVVQGQNATTYLQKYKDIENNGTLINTSRSMIPNIFTRNK